VSSRYGCAVRKEGIAVAVRTHVATGAGRLVRLVLRKVAHRQGSQLPGRVALAIDPAAISGLAARVRQGCIAVSGTNGKTTTTNLIASAIEESGLSVASNRDGANMAAGIASALLEHGPDWAVLEVDELSTVRVMGELRPAYFVLLNLFRDQLDRAGEIDHVQDTIVEALRLSPQTTLVACADDPLVWAVARRAARSGTRVLSFGVASDLHVGRDRVSGARFCPECGARLDYAWHTFAHLGSFSCPTCDFSRPEPDFAASEVEVSPTGVACMVEVSGRGPARLRSGLGGAYAVYDLLAAWAAAHLAGVTASSFADTLSSFSPENGRLEHFRVRGREVVLNLAKNPTGLNLNIGLMLQDPRARSALIVVNDEPNDGRDVSWIWDVDFERLQGNSVTPHCGGERARDVQVRLRYAGMGAEIACDVAAALELTEDVARDGVLYVLTNYSALAPARQELLRLEGRR